MSVKSFLTLPLLALSIASANAASEPVVLTIDGEPIYKSEFEYVYNKNNAATAAEKKSVNDYLDLFINYKLKVLNAKENGLDQERSFKEEFLQYREQLAMPYFMNKSDVSELVHEAYERLKWQVSCSHILVKYNSRDSVSALEKITRIQKELKGGANFADLAKKYSDCPSGKNGGYLGNVTCFQMVYPFENVIYSLQPGQVSEPFQTKFGYHIAEVLDVKPNVLRKKPSQIYFPASDPRAEQKIDSLMNLLKKGADFKQLAIANNSGSFAGNGQLDWMDSKSAEIPPEVLSTVMGLEKVGDLKKTQSRIGWHIFRLDSTNTDIPYENCQAEIRDKILHSDRVARANQMLMAGLHERYNVTVDSLSLADFVAVARDREGLELDKEYAHFDKPLYSYLDETYPQKDFIPFFNSEREKWNSVMDGKASNRMSRAFAGITNEKAFVNACFNRFLNAQVLEKSYEQLEIAEPEYRNLLNEYSDGLLLFNISSAKVWDVASKDVAGLTDYFNANKEKYKWSEPRFRGMIVYCVNPKVKKKVAKYCKKHPDMDKKELSTELYKMFEKAKDPQISIKRGVFAKGMNKAVDFYFYKQDSAYIPERKGMPEVYLSGSGSSMPEVYTEVRGAVVADYQNKLDADWITTLRREHKVKVNEDVLNTIK